MYICTYIHESCHAHAWVVYISKENVVLFLFLIDLLERNKDLSSREIVRRCYRSLCDVAASNVLNFHYLSMVMITNASVLVFFFICVNTIKPIRQQITTDCLKCFLQQITRNHLPAAYGKRLRVIKTRAIFKTVNIVNAH